MFQVLPIASCPIIEHCWAEPGSALFTHSLQIFPFINEILLHLLFFNSPISSGWTVPFLAAIPYRRAIPKPWSFLWPFLDLAAFKLLVVFFFKDIYTDNSQSHSIKCGFDYYKRSKTSKANHKCLLLEESNCIFIKFKCTDRLCVLLTSFLSHGKPKELQGEIGERIFLCLGGIKEEVIN